MVGESCLLEEPGSKWHVNYTLEWSTSCSCSIIWTAGLMTVYHVSMADIIGASLSEPHSSDVNGDFM